MKHNSFLMRCLTAAVLLTLSSKSWAYGFSYNGIWYDIIDGSSNVKVANSINIPDYSGDIVIPATVSYDGTEYDVKSIGDYAFKGCSGLTSVNIPNSVTSIGEYAFFGCSNLTSVNIPNSVTSIGEFAFYGCSSLTSINIPNNVTSIEYNVFNGCSGLTSINIPNNVTSIELGAFRNCSGLTSVSIGNRVENIESSAFEGCTGLKIANFASIESLCSISFTNLSANPLRYAHSLYIDGKEVTELTIPDGVESIGMYTFCYCIGLTSVNIPNSVTSIEGFAFQSCNGLTSVNIPNSVTSIGEYAFRACKNLTSVSIGNRVENIGDGAFMDCTNLTDVYSNNLTPPEVSGTSFQRISNTPTLYVPAVAKQAYAKDYWLRNFFTNIMGVAEVNITDAEYTAYVTEFDMDFRETEGLTAYKVTKATTDWATLEEIEQAEAGTAVILHGEAGTYTLQETATEAVAHSDNLFLPGGSQQGDGKTIYGLGNKNSVGFYLVGDGVTVPEGKGYLVIEPTTQTTGAKEFIPFGGDGVTGIDTVVEENVEKDGAIYNLAGQRIAQPQKSGIYIVNGKKVFINK